MGDRGAEVIEFLPPRDDAFGPSELADFVGVDGDDDAGFDDEPPRSRWLTALAAVGVTGLLVVGVVAAAPWSDDDAAPAPTTTVPAPTTTTDNDGRPASISTEPTLPRDWPTEPAGWIPEPDSSFVAVNGWSYGDDAGGFGFPDSGAVLHTSGDDVGRTSGRWVAITVVNTTTGGFHELRADGVEVQVGDRRVLVSSSSDGLVRLDVALLPGPATAGVAITGSGLDLGALLTLAGQVGIDWQRRQQVVDVSASTVAGGPLDGLQPVDVDDLWLAPFTDMAGAPLAWTDVVDGRTGTWLQARLYRTDDRADLVRRLLLLRSLEPDELTLDIERRLDDLARRGLRVELSRVDTTGSVVGEALLGDGSTLSVTGATEPATVLAAIAALRPATEQEWLDLLTRSANGGAIDLDIDIDVEPSRTPLGMGLGWSAEVIDGHLQISAQTAGVWTAFEHGQGPQLVEYRNFDAAFVLATTTFPDTARKVSLVQGGVEVDASALRELPGTGVLATVMELDPTLPYTITWTDADGAPVDGPVDATASSAARTEPP